MASPDPQTPSHSPFTSLANIPDLKSPLLRWPAKFVVVFNEKNKQMYCIRQGTSSVLRYSFSTDSWIEYKIEPPLNLPYSNDYRDPTTPAAAIDPDRNIIYLCDDGTGNSVKIELFDDDRRAKSQKIAHPHDAGRAPKAFVLDNEFHLVGFNRHYVYGEEDGDFASFFLLHELETDRSKIEWIENHGLAKVNEEKVIIFGGRNDPEYQTFEFDFGYTDTVRSYDIVQDEWTKLKVKAPQAFMGFGCTSVLNGKYVLVVGGEATWDGEGGGSCDICVYLVKGDELVDCRASSIVCPGNGCQYQAVAVSDDAHKHELISFGYIRSEWQKYQKDQDRNPDPVHPSNFPDILMKIVSQYHFDEFVHLFRDDGSHVKISAFAIIDNCSGVREEEQARKKRKRDEDYLEESPTKRRKLNRSEAV